MKIIDIKDELAKLPVVHKAHIYEPEIGQVVEVAYKAGIKEVVEWISSHSEVASCDPDTAPYYRPYRWIDEAEWQAQLKEWGIE